MADYDNRVRIDLSDKELAIPLIFMNKDEQRLYNYPTEPGSILSSKVVIRINEDKSWTAFRGDFAEPADAVIKHGLTLDEVTARALFARFAKFHPHPYRFGK